MSLGLFTLKMNLILCILNILYYLLFSIPHIWFVSNSFIHSVRNKFYVLFVSIELTFACKHRIDVPDSSYFLKGRSMKHMNNDIDNISTKLWGLAIEMDSLWLQGIYYNMILGLLFLIVLLLYLYAFLGANCPVNRKNNNIIETIRLQRPESIQITNAPIVYPIWEMQNGKWKMRISETIISNVMCIS